MAILGEDASNEDVDQVEMINTHSSHLKLGSCFCNQELPGSSDCIDSPPVNLEFELRFWGKGWWGR